MRLLLLLRLAGLFAFGRKTRFEKDYEIQRKLSEGGTATVYRAWDKKGQRPVIMKVIKDEIQDMNKGTPAFVFEGEIGKRLQHPNLVATLDYGKNHEGNRVVVLDQIAGLLLRQLIGEPIEAESAKVRRFRQVAQSLRYQILRKTADGLLYMHQKGYVHLDLYPRNIMVQFWKRRGDPQDTPKVNKAERNEMWGEEYDCEPKIIDLGFAAPLGAAGKIRHQGPAPYMAPEAFPRSKAKVAEQADVFSFGVIAYQMLTGRLPWDNLETYTTVAPRAPKDLPEELCALLFGAVQHDPDRRPSLARMITVLKRHEEAGREK
jgi:serine/threonine-protein kinase